MGLRVLGLGSGAEGFGFSVLRGLGLGWRGLGRGIKDRTPREICRLLRVCVGFPGIPKVLIG